LYNDIFIFKIFYPTHTFRHVTFKGKDSIL
jgi:hypothetical protein